MELSLPQGRNEGGGGTPSVANRIAGVFLGFGEGISAFATQEPPTTQHGNQFRQISPSCTKREDR